MSGEIPSIERERPHEDEIEEKNTEKQTIQYGEIAEKQDVDVLSKDHFIQMATELMELPDQILAEERKAIAATRKIDSYDKRSRELEAEIYAEVNAETDKDGKKKYSNEKLRDTETNKRLNENIEMQQIRENKWVAVETQQTARTEYEYLKRKMKSFELIGMLARVKLKID